MAIDAMKAQDADEVLYPGPERKELADKPGIHKVALETETTNTAAIKLYERLGFLRSKRLHRYYFNGNSAFRLILYLKPSPNPSCGCEGNEHEHNHDHDQDHSHSHDESSS